MWCPKCKSEYLAGVTYCADCKVELVDELPEEDEFEEALAAEEISDYIPEDDDTEDTSINRTYKNKKDKAEDFKSSAYTLLIVGVVGMVALVLLELGIIPSRLAAPGKYLTYLVMGGLFIVFIVMGFNSLKSSKKYASEAADEDERTARIMDWAKENITKERVVSAGALSENVSEEEKYFTYSAIIKAAIFNEFTEKLDNAYLDDITEEIYASLFEN